MSNNTSTIAIERPQRQFFRKLYKVAARLATATVGVGAAVVLSKVVYDFSVNNPSYAMAAGGLIFLVCLDPILDFCYDKTAKQGQAEQGHAAQSDEELSKSATIGADTLNAQKFSKVIDFENHYGKGVEKPERPGENSKGEISMNDDNLLAQQLG